MNEYPYLYLCHTKMCVRERQNEESPYTLAENSTKKKSKSKMEIAAKYSNIGFSPKQLIKNKHNQSIKHQLYKGSYRTSLVYLHNNPTCVKIQRSNLNCSDSSLLLTIWNTPSPSATPISPEGTWSTKRLWCPEDLLPPVENHCVESCGVCSHHTPHP